MAYTSDKSNQSASESGSNEPNLNNDLNKKVAQQVLNSWEQLLNENNLLGSLVLVDLVEDKSTCKLTEEEFTLEQPEYSSFDLGEGY